MLRRQWSAQCRGSKVSKVHLFFFSRSVVDDDLNSLLEWKWVKSTSLSRSISISSSFRSIVDNNPNRLLHRKWAESSSLSFLDQSSRMIWRISLRKLSAIHFLVSKWVFSFSRSILDDDPKTLSIESEWNPLLFLSPNQSLLSLDQSSTMIQALSSIEGQCKSLLFLQMNFFPILVLSSAVSWKCFSIETKWNPALFLSSNHIFLFQINRRP